MPDNCVTVLAYWQLNFELCSTSKISDIVVSNTLMITNTYIDFKRKRYLCIFIFDIKYASNMYEIVKITSICNKIIYLTLINKEKVIKLNECKINLIYVTKYKKYFLIETIQFASNHERVPTMNERFKDSCCCCLYV